MEGLDGLLRALPSQALVARVQAFASALTHSANKRVEEAVAEVNRAWLERWRTRDGEWREIVAAMKSKYAAAALPLPQQQLDDAQGALERLRAELGEALRQRDAALAALAAAQGGVAQAAPAASGGAMQSALGLAALALCSRART